MPTNLCLRPQTLYPIITHDEDFHLISDTLLFSNLIATDDFSRVMSKMQLLRQKKTPLNMMFSIKTHNGFLQVFMHGEYKNNAIYVTLYDLNRMDQNLMKQIKYQ